MNDTPSHCLHCEKPILRGRVDKKFCDEGCKSLYHNKQKIADHGEVRKVHLSLKKNHRILKRLLNGRQAEIFPIESLQKEGFDFIYHTHHVTSKAQGNEYLFCYNYGYRKLEDGKVKVVKSFV